MHSCDHCEDCLAEQDSVDSADQWSPAQLTRIEAFEAWYRAAKRHGKASQPALAAYETYRTLTVAG